MQTLQDDLACPFCAAPLQLDSDADLGEGETGGMCNRRTLRCAACTARLVQVRVDKIGEASEWWHLDTNDARVDVARCVAAAEQAGRTANAACPRCKGPAWSTMPLGHVPLPAHQLANGYPAHPKLTVRADPFCLTCSAPGVD